VFIFKATKINCIYTLVHGNITRQKQIVYSTALL